LRKVTRISAQIRTWRDTILNPEGGGARKRNRRERRGFSVGALASPKKRLTRSSVEIGKSAGGGEGSIRKLGLRDKQKQTTERKRRKDKFGEPPEKT